MSKILILLFVVFACLGVFSNASVIDRLRKVTAKVESKAVAKTDKKSSKHALVSAPKAIAWNVENVDVQPSAETLKDCVVSRFKDVSSKQLAEVTTNQATVKLTDGNLYSTGFYAGDSTYESSPYLFYAYGVVNDANGPVDIDDDAKNAVSYLLYTGLYRNFDIQNMFCIGFSYSNVPGSVELICAYDPTEQYKYFPFYYEAFQYFENNVQAFTQSIGSFAKYYKSKQLRNCATCYFGDIQTEVVYDSGGIGDFDS